MARPRTAMRDIREVLRLAHETGLSERRCCVVRSGGRLDPFPGV
jgi:hypothetical protein